MLKGVNFIAVTQLVCLIAMAWVVIDLKRDLHETHMLYKNESHWAIACNQSIDYTVTAVGKMILEHESRIANLERNETATTYQTASERAGETEVTPPLELPSDDDPYMVAADKPSEEVETPVKDETAPTVEPIPSAEDEEDITVGEAIDLPVWAGDNLKGVTK